MAGKAVQALKAGGLAPDFTLKDQDEKQTRLSDFRGNWIVLYFYPKDNTPGCTIEANDFTKLAKDFERLGAVILGMSPDSCQSHAKFVAGHKLKIDLLSDPDKKILETYGVWGEKQFMGNKYMGVARTTFLIDPDGKIAYVWESVKAMGHALAVKEKLQEVQKSSVSSK